MFCTGLANYSSQAIGLLGHEEEQQLSVCTPCGSIGRLEFQTSINRKSAEISDRAPHCTASKRVLKSLRVMIAQSFCPSLGENASLQGHKKVEEGRLCPPSFTYGLEQVSLPVGAASPSLNCGMGNACLP